MKKTFQLFGFGALVFMGAFVVLRNVDAATSNPVISQTDSRKNANYIFVYNDDNVAHEDGDVLIYVLPASATYPGISVSSTTTANVVRVAGVVPDGGTLPAQDWGWLQVYGYHPSVSIAVANAAGDSLVTSTTGESAGVLTLAVSTSTVGADGGIFATALEATTSSTTVKALIRIQ